MPKLTGLNPNGLFAVLRSEPPRPPRQLCSTANGEYRVEISPELEDRAWDDFLVTTPGGHHVQTSLWAQVKAPLRWRATRIVVTRAGRIVGGAQILMRSMPLLGAFGYVPKGPVLASADAALVEVLMNQLAALAKPLRLKYLAVQAPDAEHASCLRLSDWGFRPRSIDILPTATILIDLAKSTDTLLAEMHPKTRYNIRLGQRNHVRIRDGTERDLETYYRLLQLTARRKNFSIFPPHYYSHLWRVFSPHGYLKLLVADCAGDVVSAQLAVAFGDTVINKLSVWSGTHGNCRPNEALQWTAIQWAKSQGFRYYDLEGIDPGAARAMLQGGAQPGAARQTVTSFKLGFGGQVVIVPPAQDCVYDAILRPLYNTAFPLLTRAPAVERVLQFVRTRP